MTWFLILFMLLSQSLSFPDHHTQNMLYSKKDWGNNHVHIIKATEESSWGAIKDMFKDDGNDVIGKKRDKGK